MGRWDDKRIRIIEDYCVLCHLCEVACVVSHSRSKDPIKAYKNEGLRFAQRFKLLFIEPTLENPTSFPAICRHCEHPFCVDACVTGALEKTDEGVVLTDLERCIGCGNCVVACPHGGIRLVTLNGERKALKCDLCQDWDGPEPACVMACPNRALVLEDREKPSLQTLLSATDGGGKEEAPYVIAGGGPAATAAVRGIRKLDPEGRIVLIAPEQLGCYSKALLAHYLVGEETEEGLIYRASDFFEKNGVEVLSGRKLVGLDVDKKRVKLDDGAELEYSKLLLAIGGKPFVPPIKGMEKEGVFTFTEFEQAKAVREFVKGAKKVVVVGAGFIGMEVAEALSRRGIEVVVVELLSRILIKALDERGSEIVRQLLKDRPIEFRTEDTVEEVIGDAKVEAARLRSGEVVDCDAVIIAIGVVPNTDPLKGTPIEIGRGVKVDEMMRTNVEDVFAAGDLVEITDLTDGQVKPIPVFPLANECGEIAGVNMAGGEAKFGGGVPINTLKFLPVEAVSGGITWGEGLEELVYEGPDGLPYRKVLLRDGRIVGFVLIGDTYGAGIYTGLIRAGADVSEFKHVLARPDFGIHLLPRRWRDERFHRDVTELWSFVRKGE